VHQKRHFFSSCRMYIVTSSAVFAERGWEGKAKSILNRRQKQIAFVHARRLSRTEKHVALLSSYLSYGIKPVSLHKARK